MKKTEIKLIIFDSYGVVLSRGYPGTCRVLAKRFKIPEEKLYEVIYKKYFNLAAERKITQKVAWQLPLQELGLSISWQELRDLHLGLFKANQGVVKIAKKLRKDYKTLMLSKNTRSQFAATKKKFSKVWQSFSAVINTWELNLPKASKKTILTVAKRFKVKPAEILYADDQKNNLIQAKKIGVKTIFYKNFKQFEKELNQYL